MDYNEALSLVQKVGSADGSSLYDHLTSIVQKVRHARSLARSRAGSGRCTSGGSDAPLRPPQVLEEKPGNAVDLLETTLLIKQAAAHVAKPASGGLQGKVRARVGGRCDD